MLNSNTCGWICLTLMGICVGSSPSSEPQIEQWLSSVQAVVADGGSHQEAAEAWRKLAQLEAGHIPDLLAALDGANPLAANWIRCAIEAIAERHIRSGGQLPSGALEAFVFDRSHDPRARRLAYELLVLVDATAEDRIIPQMLNDPSVELRRDAVARLIAQADRLAETGRTDRALPLWEQALDAARDRDQVDRLARQLESAGRKVDLARHFGFILQWKIIGPFDNTAEAGFDMVYPPEHEFQQLAVYEGKNGSVRWRDYATQHSYGEVDLNAALGEQKGVIAYAAHEFFAAESTRAEIRASSENALKVWLNGELVGEFPVYHSGSQMDQYVCPVTLKAGRNLILVKVCQNEQTQPWARYWRFQLRVCDPTGGAVLSTQRK